MSSEEVSSRMPVGARLVRVTVRPLAGKAVAELLLVAGYNPLSGDPHVRDIADRVEFLGLGCFNTSAVDRALSTHCYLGVFDDWATCEQWYESVLALYGQYGKSLSDDVWSLCVNAFKMAGLHVPKGEAARA